MTKTSASTNFTKHTSKNPIQKLLIKNFYSSLISLAKPLKAETILDVGCGEGFTMEKLLKSGVGKKIEGIEYAKDVISFGKKLFPDLTFTQGSVYELPYKDNSFDLVVCTEVLEHLEDPQKALPEIIRVSKTYIILSVPNEPFFRLANFLRGKYVAEFGNSPGHINHWTFFSFQKFLKKNGIKINKMLFPFPWIIVLIEK